MMPPNTSLEQRRFHLAVIAAGFGLTGDTGGVAQFLVVRRT